MTAGDAPDLHDLAWPRRTERLSLRPLSVDDVDAVWAYRSDPTINRWTGRSPRTRDELVEHFFTSPRLESTLVVERDAVVVGDLMVMVQDAWAQPEVKDRARRAEVLLGWTLAPRHQGHGLMTEAVAEVLRVCFTARADGGLGVRRVVADCFAANEPSWRLMERLGMRREAHHVADSLHRDLGWLDEYAYAILAEEWRDGAGLS